MLNLVVNELTTHRKSDKNATKN